MQQDQLGTTAVGVGSTKPDETDRLIASDKVEGTAVYNRQGERLGSIHNFMVGKRSGTAIAWRCRRCSLLAHPDQQWLPPPFAPFAHQLPAEGVKLVTRCFAALQCNHLRSRGLNQVP